MEFDLGEVLAVWPDPVIFVGCGGTPLGLTVSEDEGVDPEGGALSLEPEDIDPYTGMPYWVPFDLRRPD